MYTFESSLRRIGDMPVFPEPVIKDEPMLFSASVRCARESGGAITQAFLNRLPGGWDGHDTIIDTRVHMLMPGWYPCIPGWHHDDVPRSRADGQPNYDTPEYKAVHIMALVNGGICPTLFAVGDITLPRVPDGEVVYEKWHPLVEAATELRVMECAAQGIYQFDWQSFHRGQKARASGWRWFGRASRRTHRQQRNEIRRQVQVYLEYPNKGW